MHQWCGRPRSLRSISLKFCWCGPLLFYRFRTVFRVLYVIRPWYESCVRPISPSDLVCSHTCVRSASALVVFVLYSNFFRRRFVVNRLLSSKMHIRYSYENFHSFFSVISLKLNANLICSYRVSCACEPSVLSIPNGILRIVRVRSVVRIMRLSSFSFWFRVASWRAYDSRAR
jgi:hypothetical protein